MKSALSFYECIFSDGDPMRWWDTQTLPYAKEFVWTSCTHRPWGCRNFKRSHPNHLLKLSLTIFTVRNEVVKVRFLHVSVCPQGGSTWTGTPKGYRYTPLEAHPPGSTCFPPWSTPPGKHTPGKHTRLGDGWRCGRYASFWNAFLLYFIFPCRLSIFLSVRGRWPHISRESYRQSSHLREKITYRLLKYENLKFQAQHKLRFMPHTNKILPNPWQQWKMNYGRQSLEMSSGQTKSKMHL